MKYSLIVLLMAFALISTVPSCAKYGCPSNTENYKPKVKKKSKLQDGVVPAEYAKKRGISGKAVR
jgi:hypothetical protein